MKYRIVKCFYGLKKYRVEYRIGGYWQYVQAGYGTINPHTFWTKLGAKKYIERMKQNSNEPLYVMEVK